MMLKHLHLTFLIVLLLFSFLVFLISVKATGANWLTGWTYRRSLLITNATGAGTNYQVRIIVVNGTNEGASTTYTTNDTITVNNKIRADFGDVNFTDATGNVALAYWMQTLNIGLNATFWIKVTADLTSTDQTIYLYYGKSDATTLSDGSSTFLFFDNFPGTSLDSNKWATTGTPSITVGNNHVAVNATAASWQGIIGKYNMTYGRWDCNGTLDTKNQHDAFGMTSQVDLNGGNQGVFYWAANTAFARSANGTASSTTITGDINNHVYEILWSSGKMVYNIDETAATTKTTNIPTVGINASVCVYGTSNTNVSMYWVFLSHYVSPEPTFSTWGSEETNGDSIPPAYSNISANTTVAGALCSFNCLVSDDTNVSSYIFSINNTGTWINDTATTFLNFFNTTAAWANVTKTLNDTVGNVVSYVWYANDTSNNWSSSDQHDLTLTAPYRPSLQMTPDNVTCRKYLETFSIQINVTNANDAQAFNFTIYYDPQVLNYSSVSWGELGTGTMTEIDTTNGILEGNVAGSPLNGNHWLLDITFQAGETIIWKAGLTNELESKIWFHQAQLNFTDNSTLQYLEGGINQIDVNQAAYTFLPIQGDVNNDGTVDIFDLRAVAAYFDAEVGDPNWTQASTYDLLIDGQINIADIYIVTSNFNFTYP